MTTNKRRPKSKSKQGESRSRAQRSGSLPTPDKSVVSNTNTTNSSSRKNPTTMALTKIDFTAVTDFKPVPAGDYNGCTVTWESKPTNDGKSMNVVATFEFGFEDDNGDVKSRKHIHYWNLKPQALWRIKRDLIALGADPAEFASDDVDLEGILNEVFDPVTPTQVILSLVVDSYRADRNDPESELRETNKMDKVKAIAF